MKKMFTLYSMATTIADFLHNLIMRSRPDVAAVAAKANVHEQHTELMKHLETLNDDNNPLWNPPRNEKLRDRLTRLQRQFVYLNGAMAHDATWIGQLAELAKTIKVSDPDCVEAAAEFERLLQVNRDLKKASVLQELALYQALMARAAEAQQPAPSGTTTGTATGTASGFPATGTASGFPPGTTATTDTATNMDVDQRLNQPTRKDPRMRHIRMVLRRLLSPNPRYLDSNVDTIVTDVNRMLPLYGCKIKKPDTMAHMVTMGKAQIMARDYLMQGGTVVEGPTHFAPMSIGVVIDSALMEYIRNEILIGDALKSADFSKQPIGPVRQEPFSRTDTSLWESEVEDIAEKINAENKMEELYTAIAEMHWPLDFPPPPQGGGHRHGGHRGGASPFSARIPSARKPSLKKTPARTRKTTRKKTTKRSTRRTSTKRKSTKRTSTKRKSTKRNTKTTTTSTKSRTQRR